MLRHDPTFDGLLSAIALCLRDGVRPEALVPDLDQLTLLPCRDVPLVPGIQARFRSELGKRMRAGLVEDVLKTAWYAYLSDDEGIGLAIHRYLEQALRLRTDPAGDLLDRDIARVVRMAKKTGTQAHAFLGLLRFRTVAPSLYLADFSPEHHVLPIVLPHFCERLPDQCFVIRDLRRGLAALHMPHRLPQVFVLAPPGEDNASDAMGAGSLGLPGFQLPAALPATLPDALPAALPGAAAGTARCSTDWYDPDRSGPYDASPSGEPDASTADCPPPADFDEMWRRYLAALTIPERRNLKLQRSHMPKKYWKYLTEMDAPPGVGN